MEIIQNQFLMVLLFQVSIADKFVDMSMASKLTKYSDLIKGAA